MGRAGSAVREHEETEDKQFELAGAEGEAHCQAAGAHGNPREGAVRDGEFVQEQGKWRRLIQSPQPLLRDVPGRLEILRRIPGVMPKDHQQRNQLQVALLLLQRLLTSPHSFFIALLASLMIKLISLEMFSTGPPAMKFGSILVIQDIIRSYRNTMPKLIDNYVLNRKIGAGQYGEVFRGYDRATNNQIAVKSIQRDKVKGKFRQLLESQIKVLKSCQNSNIIRLYDMKKTSNNFYLIMEYCNGGDLDAYVKKRKYLTEDEAIQIMCELIHGFQHLYKHKILHRDLKLANILLHDGAVKIADFGFSKILGEQQLAATMLGSPLNMAPQVLQNQEYSNKADIYSLGVCYYWMLFGKPPFNAKNVVELKNVIMRQQIIFPKQINCISEMSENLIRKMLKAKPSERMSWQELFKHPINSYLQKKMENELHLTLTMEGEISENVCKLYLNQNLVIIHPSQFKKKEDVVNYAVGVITDKKKTDFKGGLKKQVSSTQKLDIKRQNVDDDGKIGEANTEDQNILDCIQFNTFYLLNERNKIIFLLSVMNQIRDKKQVKGQAELLGSISKLTRQYYDKLSKVVRQRKNSYNLKYWDDFLRSPSFKNVEHFLIKEEAIVMFELGNVQKVAQKSQQSLKSLVKAYAELKGQQLKSQGIDEKVRQEWIQLSHVIDVGMLQKIMTQDFDFKHYYCEYGKYEMKELIDVVRDRIKNF